MAHVTYNEEAAERLRRVFFPTVEELEADKKSEVSEREAMLALEASRLTDLDQLHMHMRWERVIRKMATKRGEDKHLLGWQTPGMVEAELRLRGGPGALEMCHTEIVAAELDRLRALVVVHYAEAERMRGLWRQAVLEANAQMARYQNELDMRLAACNALEFERANTTKLKNKEVVIHLPIGLEGKVVRDTLDVLEIDVVPEFC